MTLLEKKLDENVFSHVKHDLLKVIDKTEKSEIIEKTDEVIERVK